MTAIPREPVRFLVFSASLRAGSLNTRLARVVAGLIAQHGGTVDSAGMGHLQLFLQNVQSQNALAPGAMELRRRLEANDAFVIVSPELASRLEKTVVGFMDLVEAAKHCPCAKKAWIEFLGEQPNAVIDRIE